MMKVIQGLFVTGILALAAGCASSTDASKSAQSVPPAQREQSAVTAPVPKPAPSANAAPPPAVANDKHVLVDSRLDSSIRVLNVISSTGKDGLLKIQVNVQNLLAAPSRLSYKVDWFDRNGEELPMASVGLMPWMLLAHETSSIVAVAPAPTVKDFGVAFVPGN
jgi:uncharacterized protein YcfL